MESTAYDQVSLDDISFENDFGFDLEPDADVEGISFEDDELTLDDLEPDEDITGIAFEDDTDDEIDLEPDEDVSHLTFEEAGERMRRETEEYLATTTGEFRVLADE